MKFAALLVALISTPVFAEMNGTLRIGVLNDMSSVYADFQGPGSVVAAQLAVEDFAKQSKRKVEVISADHQNKPDVGAGVARRWLDVEGVDMIIDLPNSAVALAVGDIVREKNKVAIGSGAGTALLTGAKCSPNFVHWTYDTWANGHALARGVLAARRQDLVLHHGRLCLRPRSRKAGQRRGLGQRRKNHRHGAPSARRLRFFVLPSAGAGFRRASRGAGECRRRYHQHRQAGGGIQNRRQSKKSCR